MSAGPTHLAAKPARSFEIDGGIEDVFAFFDDCYEKGWTDGLPVFPPTEKRVADMLRYTDRSPGDVVGIIAPRNGAATVEKIAINAVMAGCRPEYLPVLITAIEAMVEPAYNLYGRQTTTHPGAHLMLVNGPVRNELDINCRQNAFGHGWRANATLGRAIRLILINVGVNKPGFTYMATHGHSGKFSYTIGEDEENSPWAPFHADRGLAPGTSAVTMLCAEAPHNINDHKAHDVQRYLGSAASSMSNLGSNGLYRSGLTCEHMLLMTAESANWVAERGWSKSDVSSYLFEHARQPVREMRDRGGWDMSPLAKFVHIDDDNAMVPIVNRPQDILIAVAGGHGRHMNAILTSGYNLSVTRAITRKDGTPVSSLKELVA
jgi:hypothetical protein